MSILPVYDTLIDCLEIIIMLNRDHDLQFIIVNYRPKTSIIKRSATFYNIVIIRNIHGALFFTTFSTATINM